MAQPDSHTPTILFTSNRTQRCKIPFFWCHANAVLCACDHLGKTNGNQNGYGKDEAMCINGAKKLSSRRFARERLIRKPSAGGQTPDRSFSSRAYRRTRLAAGVLGGHSHRLPAPTGQFKGDPMRKGSVAGRPQPPPPSTLGGE